MVNLIRDGSIQRHFGEDVCVDEAIKYFKTLYKQSPHIRGGYPETRIKRDNEDGLVLERIVEDGLIDTLLAIDFFFARELDNWIVWPNHSRTIWAWSRAMPDIQNHQDVADASRSFLEKKFSNQMLDVRRIINGHRGVGPPASKADK